MLKKKLEWGVVSIAAGMIISLLMAWLTVWVFLQSESPTSRYETSYTKYAFGVGPEDNRWAIDIEEHSFGVYMNILNNWKEFYEIGASPKMHRSGPGMIPGWSRAREDASAFEYGHNILEVAAGWPLTAWKGEWRTSDSISPATRWYSIPVKNPMRRYPILLPLLPIFPGGLFNALFWGGIFYVFTTDTKRSIWFFIRRHRRRKGLCPHCAYDITGLTTCPECGQPVADPINT